MSGSKLVDDVNLARIRWCCEEAGMTLEALADAVGVDAEKLEQGGLNDRELDGVGEYFGYTETFLRRSGLPDKEKVYTQAYRSILARDGVVDIGLQKFFHLVETSRNIYLQVLESMERAHRVRLPSMSGEAVDAARQARTWLGVSDDRRYGFDDYRRRLEAKGILVFMASHRLKCWKPHNENNLAGFAIDHESQPTICVNEFTPQRRIFTLFHALGHLLMHRDSYAIRKSDLSGDFHGEKGKVNDFAERFLRPNESLDADAVDGASSLRYDGYRNVIRDQSPAEETASDENALPLHLESERVYGEPYVKVILEALRERQVTLHKACQYLELNVTEVEKLQARYEIWGSGS